MIPQICLTHLTTFERCLILIDMVKVGFRTYDVYALFPHSLHMQSLLSISETIQKTITQLDVEMVHFSHMLASEAATVGASAEHRKEFEELTQQVTCLMEEARYHNSMAHHSIHHSNS